MEILIEKTKTPKQKPVDENNLGFGQIFTDHMFCMKYEEGKGWHDAKIVPYGNFTMNPASMVFHYAQECFEGMKAYRNSNGDIRLFRPEKNAERMASTHRRLCMPEISVEDFVQAVKALVNIDRDWVPSMPDTSLYIRPCTIATDERLGVHASKTYLFFIICSPSGAYYPEGLNPTKIYVEDEYTRAAPGGTGEIKCGGNYAASLKGQEKAERLGYSQVLWLDGVERKYVEEVGSMNCFFKINGEIYTAPLSGTVLPGITRMSVIELLKDWGYKVNEEKIAIEKIVEHAKNNELEEIFGTGTAAVINPVGEIGYKDENYIVNNNLTGELTQKLYSELTGIQWGKLEDNKGWTILV